MSTSTMKSTTVREQGGGVNRTGGQYCTFMVAGLYLGIEVLQVQEVLRYQQLTRVPMAAPEIGGMINLRGQIVTAIDLRLCLGLEPRQGGGRPMNVVVRTDEGTTSLLVDEIREVVTVDEAAFEPVPQTLSGVGREMFLGTYKLKDKLLLVLDTGRVMAGLTAAA